MYAPPFGLYENEDYLGPGLWIEKVRITAVRNFPMSGETQWFEDF